MNTATQSLDQWESFVSGWFKNYGVVPNLIKFSKCFWWYMNELRYGVLAFIWNICVALFWFFVFLTVSFDKNFPKFFSSLRHLLACCQNLLVGQEWPLISSRVTSEDTKRHTYRTWTEVYYRNAETSWSLNRLLVNAMQTLSSKASCL